MDELRIKLLQLLKEIDQICKKHNITYYAEGGTIIGALRHEGFIPWDDDIDLVMTRDNFNKFAEVFKKNPIPDRSLEFPENNKKYPVVTVKYVDTQTTSIFKSLFLDITAGGIDIDIFILDPIPRGKEKWFKKNFLSYTEILCPYYIINNESSTLKYYIDLLKCKIFGREKVLDKYRKKLFQFSDDECNEYLIRFGITYQTVKKEYYSKPRIVKFENTKIPIPRSSEIILSDFFGYNWYMIPNIEDQQTHNVVRNLNLSYRYYKKDYLRYIKPDVVRDNFNTIKKLGFSKKRCEIKNTRGIYLLNSYKHSILLKNEIDINKVISFYNEKKYYALDKYTQKYFDFQNSSVYRKNKIILDLDPTLIYYILNNAIITGKYYETLSIINLFDNNYKIDELKIITDNLKRAKKAYYNSDYTESLSIVNDLLQKNPDNGSAFKIKLDIILNDKLEYKEYKELAKEINRFIKITKDYELYKYLGDIYYYQNDINKACEYYEKVLKNSNNGILILDINKKMKY